MKNDIADILFKYTTGEATLEETQCLLKQSAYAQLYPKSKRDAIITYGILHHMELHAINDKLFAENEKTLF